MVGVDPQTVEAARRAVQHVRRAAEQAARAATHAAAAAAHHERLLAESPEKLAGHRARTLAISRQSAQRQQTAEKLLLNYARRLEGWAAREDAATLMRPVLMSEVAHTAGWAAAVLTVRDRTGGESLVAASSSTARRAHELQIALNEGPTVEASHGLESIAWGTELERRWPRFGREAGDLGVASAATVPLRISTRGVFGFLGAVGPPTPAPPDELAGLRTMAGALTEGVLLASHAVHDADTDMSSLQLFEPEDFQPALHQAAGVLQEPGSRTLDEAIALIRARAYAEGRPVADVAQDVIRLRALPP